MCSVFLMNLWSDVTLMKLVQRANGAKNYLDVFGLITALPAGGDGGQLQYCSSSV